jgi:hypothetical protein
VPRERREHHRTAQRPATAGGDGVRQISGGGPQKRAFLAVERFSTAVGSATDGGEGLTGARGSGVDTYVRPSARCVTAYSPPTGYNSLLEGSLVISKGVR